MPHEPNPDEVIREIQNMLGGNAAEPPSWVRRLVITRGVASMAEVFTGQADVSMLWKTVALVYYSGLLSKEKDWFHPIV